ncbi:MAG: hypothetical protein U0174_03255 [Polyangiaceae bacterium]
MRVSVHSFARNSLVATLVLTALGGTGCKSLAKRAAEKAIEERTGAKSVDLGSSSGSVEVNDGKGTRVAAGQSVRLPSDWPSFVPQYPGSTISVAAHNASTNEYTAAMVSGDTPDQIIAFYKPKVTGAGFKAEGHVNAGSLQSDTFKHKDGRTVIIMVTEADGKHNIMVSVKNG